MRGCLICEKKYNIMTRIHWPLNRPLAHTMQQVHSTPGSALRTLLCSLLMGAALALPALHARADDLSDATQLLRQKQHAQALDKVNQFLAAKPRDAQGRFLRGLILADQNKTAEAIDVFTKLTQDFPELPEPYNNLAVLYASQGQYEKARQALEMSIRTHPSYATAYENLGDVYAKLASQAYDKALQLDSSNSAAQNKLALVRDLVGTAPRPGKPAAVVASAPTAEKPAADKPAADKPAPAKPAADAGAEVIAAVNAWASAWSKKDVDGYLAFYAKDFKAPGGEAREAWEAGRRTRITAPKSISVTIDAPKATVNGDQATVSFRQGYQSDITQGSSNKTLVMAKSSGRWPIQQEKVGK